MPLFTAPSQCYMLPSGFYVLAEIARGEPLGAAPPYFYPMSDADMEAVRAQAFNSSGGVVSTVLTNGKFLFVSDAESDTAQEKLDQFAVDLSGMTIPPNFVGATWPAGGTPYTVTAANPLQFTESDRESFEVAIGKAIQETGMYYDVASVTRYANTLTVTLDESQKPYDAGWDSVLALVADWYGGELP